MEKRIKIFWDEEVEETRVNAWLSQNGGKLHESHFIAWPIEEGSSFALVLLYTPEERNEKKECYTKEDEKSDGRIQERIASFWKQRGTCCAVPQTGLGNWTFRGTESWCKSA
jgi:hypothetical protein